MRTQRLIKLFQISIFAAIAVIIAFFEIPVFFVPSLYKLDFSDSIVLISGFSLGPVAGILTEFLKILIRLLIKGSTTFGIGDFANFVMGTSLILPSTIFYKKHRCFKGACIGMLLGICCLIVTAIFTNYFILIPAYENLFSISEINIISLVSSVNPLIVDKLTFILFAVCPFNLFKGLSVCLIALMLYKKLSVKINNLSFKFAK